MGCFFRAFGGVLRARVRRGPLRPSWSFAFETIVRFLRLDWESTRAWPLPETRRAVDARPYPRDMVRRVTTREESLAGLRTRWFVPKGAPDGTFVLFLHGGSFAFGSAWTTHADLAARIALASGITVVAPDMRLAPEDPFPAAPNDVLAAYEALSAQGRVIVLGDSSGGNLALGVVVAAKEKPLGTVLVSPWADLTMPGASFDDNDAFDFGDRATLAMQARAYAGGVALDDARVSPFFADLSGLPPSLVTVGDAELLRDDVMALAAKLREAGNDVTLHVAKDMPHNAPVFAAFHPHGQAAIDAIASFVKARV